MLLTIAERLTLLSVLPTRGNVVTLRVVRDLQQDLALTEEEIQEYSVTRVEGGARWDPRGTDATSSIDVAMGEVRQTVIRDTLSSSEKKGRLPMHALSLYERFCEQPPTPDNAATEAALQDA